MSEAATARHTRLTKRDFAGFAGMMLLLEFVIVGMGAVDLLMITPFGVTHIAALGLAELITIAVFAFFTGLVHTYASRLALAEGEGELARRLPVLAGASVLLLLLFQLAGQGIGWVMEPALHAMRQDPGIVPLVGDYVGVRFDGVAPALVATALGVTLRVCGAKRQAVLVLVAGFVGNIVLDYAFLYTPALGFFASPESGVATATVLTHCAMVPLGAWFLVRLFRERGERFAAPSARAVLAEFASLSPTACGVGARNINDYLSSTLPILFIGTMGAGAVVATAVATKVYTLYCRIPQSCFEAAFVFYGYAGSSARSVLLRTRTAVMSYSAAVTAVTTAGVLLASPWLLLAFSGEGVDRTLTQWMFLAYMVSMPVYFFDQILARFLTVHQRGGVLFATSLPAYLVALPLAWYAAFVLDSAFLAIASRGAVFALSALYFWWVLRRDHWSTPSEGARLT